MLRYLVFILLLALSHIANAQSLTGEQLLDKAISFHDPNNNWNTFKGSLNIRMETPNSSDRLSIIKMDLPKSIFEVEVSKDNDRYSYNLKGEDCSMVLNGSSEISEEDKERLRLSCERGQMYRNYYTYLYGLPMKLKDSGTIIDKKVTQRTFKGKDYLVLKASYDPEVGKDTWFFYFDPKTYAMEVYQFYHDESKNDGEYILLSGLEEINGIKMPKSRAWYYNKDDKHLGTDILSKK